MRRSLKLALWGAAIALAFLAAWLSVNAYYERAFEEEVDRLRAAGVRVDLEQFNDGTFPDEVTDFAGRFCKEADRDIIRNLRARGVLFKEEVYRHDYPFCCRAMDATSSCMLSLEICMYPTGW